MAKLELFHGLSVGTQVAITPAVHNASIAIATAPTIDTYGFDAILLQLICGVITDGTHTLAVYESDTDVTANYTLVGAGDLLGAFIAVTTGTAGNQKVGYIGGKRFLRVIDTLAGQTTGGIYSLVAICGQAKHRPVAVV